MCQKQRQSRSCKRNLAEGSGDTRPASQGVDRRATRRLIWAVCALLVLAVGLVFGQTVTHEFVNWDDGDYVYENAHVLHGMSVEGVVWAFTHRHSANWHPLTWMSHMLDCQVYGLWAGGHHLTNVLLHAATCVGLFLVLMRMTGRLWPSALVAALFAIHPLRVESVAWVAERKDVLAGLFFVLTIWAYVEYVRKPFSMLRYLLVVACFALGLMAKPMLVTLPAVLLLLDYWPLRRLGTPAGVRGLWPLLVEKLPLLAIAGLSSAVTLWAQQQALVATEHLPLSTRLANAAATYVAYLGKFVWPARLAVFYPIPSEGTPIWVVAAACGILVGITAAVFAVRRSHPYLLVGWLWYLGMLIPVIGIVQAGTQAMADRYTYLPQIGLGIALVWGGTEFLGRASSRRWLGCVAVGGVLVGLMGAAWWQTTYWHDSVAMWTQTLENTSGNFIAHYNLGIALADRGQVDEAVAHYKKAIEIHPGYFEAYNNLGLSLAGRGQFDEAIAHYKKAIEIKPDFEEAHNNLGLSLAGRGQVDEAIRHYKKAIEIRPDFEEAHNNLGVALASHGQLDEAIAHYKKAIEIKPDFEEAHNNLGIVLAGRGQLDAAIAHYKKAIEIKPDFAEAHNNLGAALAGHGQIDDAIIHFQKALRINRDFEEAHNNLGLALVGRGRFDEAIRHYKQAIELKPDYAAAHYNLGLALASRKQIDEAITHFQKALDLKPDNTDARKHLSSLLSERERIRQVRQDNK